MEQALENATIDAEYIIDEYIDHLKNKEFPCVAAREAVNRNHVKCFVADHLACPKDDSEILQFLYSFVDEFRSSGQFYYSAAIIFKEPGTVSEEMFEALLWKRLQSLADLDAVNYKYDNRVDADPLSEKFSFSIKEEAFYIIGLHANSSRPSRKFKFPVLVFNPHTQFEQLKQTSSYKKMQNIVRKRDIAYSGSINPMLKDFGESSEVYQYSGRNLEEGWQCPLKINHATTNHNSPT